MYTFTVVHCDGKGKFKIEKVKASSARAALGRFAGRRMTTDEIAAMSKRK